MSQATGNSSEASNSCQGGPPADQEGREAGAREEDAADGGVRPGALPPAHSLRQEPGGPSSRAQRR